MSADTTWNLPNDVLVLIFSFLPAEDVGRAASVCDRWSQVAKNRRVWRRKDFLYEGSRGLSGVLPVFRAVPVLKRVSITWGTDTDVYLNGELADFKVPDLRDTAVTSAISALVTENLSVDFGLLEETCSNCLVVQLHELKQLKVCAGRNDLPQIRPEFMVQNFVVAALEGTVPRGTVAAKLQALSSTLCSYPLSNLKSVDIHAKLSSMPCDVNVESYILGALSTCSALERVEIKAPCRLSWHTVTEFSKLEFLQLRLCCIDDVSFLNLCPNLRSLSLDDCSVLGRRLQLWKRLLPGTTELRSLILRSRSVTREVVNTLCDVSPKLETIRLDECPDGIHTLFLDQCQQLRCLEVSQAGTVSLNVGDLPTVRVPNRRQDSLFKITSESLAEILQGLPRLEILDINCIVESLTFLRHCPHLTELSLNCSNTYRHFGELGRLTGLKKLHLCYNDRDVGPLADVLCKMPQLEVLTLLFRKSASSLSFFHHCRQLHSLILGFNFGPSEERLCLHEISNLKELRKLVLNYKYLVLEDLAALLPSMPHLEELRIGHMYMECNFSFLEHCSQLESLQISCLYKQVSHLTQLRQLEDLRRLTVIGLSDAYLPPLREEVLKLPKLEYLGLEKDGPNFLESWEWRKMLSSLRSRARQES